MKNWEAVARMSWMDYFCKLLELNESDGWIKEVKIQFKKGIVRKTIS
jgi:hypothetical protein